MATSVSHPPGSCAPRSWTRDQPQARREPGAGLLRLDLKDFCEVVAVWLEVLLVREYKHGARRVVRSDRRGYGGARHRRNIAYGLNWGGCARIPPRPYCPTTGVASHLDGTGARAVQRRPGVG